MATRSQARRPNDRTVTLDEGRRALVVAARLVDLYGEIYLPLFERLEAEFMELQRRGSAVERARQIARAGKLADDTKSRIPEAWPLLLDRAQLRAYLNMSDETISKVVPVRPVDLGVGMSRWSRPQVDAWVESLRPKLRDSNKPATIEAQAPSAEPELETADDRRRASLEKMRAVQEKARSRRKPQPPGHVNGGLSGPSGA